MKARRVILAVVAAIVVAAASAQPGLAGGPPSGPVVYQVAEQDGYAETALGTTWVTAGERFPVAVFDESEDSGAAGFAVAPIIVCVTATNTPGLTWYLRPEFVSWNVRTCPYTDSRGTIIYTMTNHHTPHKEIARVTGTFVCVAGWGNSTWTREALYGKGWFNRRAMFWADPSPTREKPGVRC